MGYFRTYLALCVVAVHSSPIFPWSVHPAHQAVQIFFIISGFYMAMILSGKYKSIKSFYISRWLRIFGPYYMILIAVVLFSVIWGLLTNNFLTLTAFTRHPLAHNGLAGILFAVITNLTLFGQDWVLFLQHDRGSAFGFTSQFGGGANPLYRYLVIPQCWSIGIEETFYLSVPFINRLRTRWLFVILAASVAARLYTYHRGFAFDPWTYRFFPFEAALFVLGMLGWRLYSKLKLDKFPKCRRYLLALPILIVGLAVHAKLMQFAGRSLGVYAALLSYPLWALVVVFLFAYFREQKADRFIGELCYPIYLIHYAVALTGASGPVTAFIVLVLAVLFYTFILKPYERWRHSLRNGEKPGDLISSFHSAETQPARP